MNLTDDIREVHGVGDQLASKYRRLNIKTVDDLIHYYPRRYDDFSKISKIKSIKPGQVTLSVRFKSITGHYLRRGLHVTEAVASDDTGSIRITWFNQPYRLTSISKDQDYYIAGKYELKYRRLAVYNPSVELVSSFPINTARIVPRYPTTKGLKSLDIRRSLSHITEDINKIKEILPTDIIESNKLVSLSHALKSIHFPGSQKDLNDAKKRLGFDELFMMILASELNKMSYLKNTAFDIKFDEVIARTFVSKLPFKLTNDQRKAVWRIYTDMAKDQPMNRLIEGDVGSGKTAVAAMAALMVVNINKQVFFMAPTELLARQHAETVKLMFSAIGLEDRVGLLVGAMTEKEKRSVHQAIKSRQVLFVIGTHSLIQDKVEAPDLALVIIDEQHRFGVKQRQSLKLKAKLQPHMLSLSATPIPRSLALTLFGELNISRLIEKPINRQPIKTKIITETILTKQLGAIKNELDSGRQMFIVGSNIETDPKYSVNELANWANKEFGKYRVGLVHGKLKSEEKSKVMDDFASHKLDILVATTVIEVGIDVPNATIMLIFDADNFGLAQLHQLRGRVGRGEYQGQAYLVTNNNDKPSDRLKALELSNDGFRLAELDLDIRGPGAIYGDLQHGALDLRIAGLDDIELIKQARESVKYFIKNNISLLKYPKLKSQVETLQKMTNLN